MPKKNYDKIPAIPPNDYRGTIADWTIGLIARGLMKEGEWYGDVEISQDKWWDLLEECEENA